MFDALKKKFGGWFGKKEEPEVKTKKQKKKTETTKKVNKKKTKSGKKKISKDATREILSSKEEAEALSNESFKKQRDEFAELKRIVEKNDLVNRIRRLSNENIDELFFKCGYIETKRGENLALPEERIDSIKNGYKFAKGFIETFIQETDINLILQTLKEIEGIKIGEKLEEKIDAKSEEIVGEVVSRDEVVREIVEEEIGEKIEEAVKQDEVIAEEKKRGFFSRLKEKISTSELTKKDFDDIFEELEITLLENNVSLEVVDKIRQNLGDELIGKQFKRKEAEEKIILALKSSIDKVLIEGENLIELINRKQGVFVILFFGINGSGKTTSIAKFAYKLKKKGISCVLAAADTFRAASIEQLEKHAQKIGVDIVKGEYGKDPSAVGFDAIQYAKKHKTKVVLIDTAGRMYTKSNLMKEMEKIVRVTQPDLKIFVGESITGNDATEQAKNFNEVAGIDGIILSKADVDEKAGTILSVSFVTGKPIFYLGVGQEYEDLEEFSKKNVFRNLGLE